MSSSTPAEVLALELCPVADLWPYHRNPRRGDVAQIAADDTGRVCYTMELHPPYVDTAVLRWQLRTGGTPLRNGTPLLLEG